MPTIAIVLQIIHGILVQFPDAYKALKVIMEDKDDIMDIDTRIYETAEDLIK